MRRTLCTALLLGFSLPALALPAIAQQSDGRTADTPHVTPQNPNGTVPETATQAKTGTTPATHHKKKKRKKPAPTPAPAVSTQSPHVTPQADHVTPQ